MKLRAMAISSMIIGAALCLIAAVVMFMDKDFDFYWELNKFTAMTTMIGVSYGFTFFGLGIILSITKIK